MIFVNMSDIIKIYFLILIVPDWKIIAVNEI